MLTVTNDSSNNNTNVRTSVGTVSTYKYCTTATVATIAIRGAVKIRTIRTVSSTILNTRVSYIVHSLSIGTIGVNVLRSSRAILRIHQRLRARSTHGVILSPIVISASKRHLVRRDTVTALRRDLVPVTSIVAPGVPRTRVLLKNAVRDRDRVGSTIITLTRHCKISMLLGTKRLRRSGLVSCVCSTDREAVAPLTSRHITAHGARNANYALSSTLTTVLTRKVPLALTTRGTGRCVTGTVVTKTSCRVNRNRKPIRRFRGF